MSQMKVKSMRGVVLDMGDALTRNERVRAVGNARMNARGDKLDVFGNVIKSAEAFVQEYNTNGPKVSKTPVSALSQPMMTAKEAVTASKISSKKRVSDKG